MTGGIDISVLVCTRNRASSLRRLLTSLSQASQAAPDIRAEFVIVDNGSSDDTAAVIAAWRTTHPLPVILLDEPRPGLARARNRGLAAAGGAIIAMTDDDCVVHRCYFAALRECFAAYPAPVIVGGRILPGDPADLPLTIKTEDHAMTASPRAFPGGFVMGANLAFTACVAARVGAFDERFGAGAPFVAAEDTDFLLRAQARGIDIQYDPRITVDHFHGRRRTCDETALLAGYSFGDGALYAKHLFSDRRVPSMLARDVADVTLDWRAPVTTHRDIKRFYRFRLRHKVRGMLAYARHAWRSPARRGEPLG